MDAYDYDMVVIGSGPAGQRAAIQAAKLDKRVAIVERKEVVGGVSVNLGTIPSKTLRESVLYLSGYRERGFYGDAYVVKHDIRLQDLLVRTDHVTRHEIVGKGEDPRSLVKERIFSNSCRARSISPSRMRSSTSQKVHMAKIPSSPPRPSSKVL